VRSIAGATATTKATAATKAKAKCGVFRCTQNDKQKPKPKAKNESRSLRDDNKKGQRKCKRQVVEEGQVVVL
jgi:hypothetical protein